MYMICVPVASLFALPDKKSEHIDEAFYGTECEIKDKFGGFCKIITDYGYTGWTEEANLCETLHRGEYIVTRPLADLLPAPENKYAPITTLPMGSKVDYGVPHDGERYGMVIFPDKTGGYLRTDAVKRIHTKAPNYREIIVETAKKFLGTQYRWGGKTVAGIDCSGLAYISYQMAGITLYRDADFARQHNLREISLDEIDVGDLIFYTGHVAIYIGGNNIIHSRGSEGVVITPIILNDITAIGTAK